MPFPAEIIAIVNKYATSTKATLIEDANDPGTYAISTTGLVEDSTDPGTFVISRNGLTEDPADPGTYLIGKS